LFPIRQGCARIFRGLDFARAMTMSSLAPCGFASIGFGPGRPRGSTRVMHKARHKRRRQDRMRRGAELGLRTHGAASTTSQPVPPQAARAVTRYGVGGEAPTQAGASWLAERVGRPAH
jgi:hypothetical protein